MELQDKNVQDNSIPSNDCHPIFVAQLISIFDKLGDNLGDTFHKSEDNTGNVFDNSHGFLCNIFPKNTPTFETKSTIDTLGMNELNTALDNLKISDEKNKNSEEIILTSNGNIQNNSSKLNKSNEIQHSNKNSKE